MDGFLNLFTTEGKMRDVAGNHPLLLDDGAGVFLVRAGRLDVFAVPPSTRAIPSARVWLCRISAGQILVSGAPGRGSLLAVGDPGSEVLQVSRTQFAEWGRRADQTATVAELLDGWLQALTAGVVRRQLPRRAVLLEAGRETTLPAKSAATPAQRVLWVRLDEGSAWFLGKAEMPLHAGRELFPLSSPGWLVAAEAGTRLTGEATPTVLRDEELWVALERFQQTILRCVANLVTEAIVAEYGRSQRRSESERRLLQETLARLAGVAVTQVSDEDAAEPIGTVLGEDALLAACRLVGARLGVVVRPPTDAGETGKRSDPISAIARASRVRLRRVKLAEGWWRHDHGPLLAFRSTGEQPVALLPTSPSSYELADPHTGTRTPVNAQNAGLLPFAYCFYRPFPTKPLRPWSLFQFSVRGSWRDWMSVLLLGLAGSVLGMFTPFIIGWVFDTIIPGAERGQVVLVVLALVVAALAAALFQFTRGIAVLRLEATMDGAAQAGIWDRLLNLPATFFRRYSTGDLAMRALGVVAIRQVMTDVALSALLSFVFSLVYFVVLFYFDVRLAALASVVFLIALLAILLSAAWQLGYQRRIYQARGKIAGLVLQLITGIARLRMAGAEERALAVWGRDFSVQKRLAYRARAAASYLAAFNAALPLLGMMVLFAAVASESRTSISLGVFLAFSAAFAQILASALELGSVVTYAIQVVPLYERARPILETLPEADPASAIPGDLSGDIELSHVSFRYQADSPLVLNDVSLHIRPGEFVAFVGPSGAGKSTIIRLLLGFEKPTAGSIYFDRADLAGLDCQAVRRQTGVVLQDGKLLTGDLFSNIIGASLLSLEDAWEAAHLAGLAEDIMQMPMGMQTMVSEGGSTLSGGQRQRLMIARAIVAKPRILLLDEATSALDNETQTQVSRSLERLKATRVVVAHRLSTIQAADRIYVLEAGCIVQSGRYEELLQQPGPFRELAQRQLL